MGKKEERRDWDRSGRVAARACGLVWDGWKIGACVRACGGRRACVRGCRASNARESADLVGGSRVLQRLMDEPLSFFFCTARSRRYRTVCQLARKVRIGWGASKHKLPKWPVWAFATADPRVRECVHGPSPSAGLAHSAATKNCPSKAQNCLLSTEPPAKI